MEGLLVLISSVAFALFLLPHAWKKQCAIVGWASIIAFLFTQLPEYFAENNFLYPLMALFSVPFLAITTRLILREDPLVFQLSRAAAVAFLIFAPFAYFEPLGNWLISVVISQVMWVLSAINYPVELVDWNMIIRHNFRIKIILACTGIQSIAIMLGVAAAVPTSGRQKLCAFLLVAPVIYVLNIFRNVFVAVAYSEQWFPFFPEIASNGEYGFESFFWAHNVICELLALFALIVIAYGLFMLIPELGAFAERLIGRYRDEAMQAVDTGKKFFVSRRGSYRRR
jgi:archaeosortase A (PGF-CTERM-specific)